MRNERRNKAQTRIPLLTRRTLHPGPTPPRARDRLALHLTHRHHARLEIHRLVEDGERSLK